MMSNINRLVTKLNNFGKSTSKEYILNNFVKYCSTNSNIEPESRIHENGLSSYDISSSVFTTVYKHEGEQFRYLLRHSNFINLGDPENKIIQGKIFHTVKDDLYIDFGWKFYCVCPRPSKDGERYVRGARVKIKIKDLELSSKFLGSEKDLTLLEADAAIIKLIYSPITITKSPKIKK